MHALHDIAECRAVGMSIKDTAYAVAANIWDVRELLKTEKFRAVYHEELLSDEFAFPDFERESRLALCRRLSHEKTLAN